MLFQLDGLEISCANDKIKLIRPSDERYQASTRYRWCMSQQFDLVCIKSGSKYLEPNLIVIENFSGTFR